VLFAPVRIHTIELLLFQYGRIHSWSGCLISIHRPRVWASLCIYRHLRRAAAAAKRTAERVAWLGRPFLRRCSLSLALRRLRCTVALYAGMDAHYSLLLLLCFMRQVHVDWKMYLVSLVTASVQGLTWQLSHLLAKFTVWKRSTLLACCVKTCLRLRGTTRWPSPSSPNELK
jgi:hypothetical protein